MPNFPSIYIELQEIWKRLKSNDDSLVSINDDISTINNTLQCFDRITRGAYSTIVIGCNLEQGLPLEASGLRSHAQGYMTKASSDYSHAEGIYTVAENFVAHSEGSGTLASGIGSHAEGYQTTASGDYSHAEGYGTIASGSRSHAEGAGSKTYGPGSHAEGFVTVASGAYSHAEGYDTKASGNYSHAEGYQTTASGYVSHAEGYGTIASGNYSHAEGYRATASNIYSHAEGYQTKALGRSDHTEGEMTTAEGSGSHAEGYQAKASGYASHAEGYNTYAQGISSHAEGRNTHALADYSHVEGYQTTSSADYQHVQGKWNATNPEALMIVGNGDDESSRSNILEVTTGSAKILGKLYVQDGVYFSSGETMGTPNYNNDPLNDYEQGLWNPILSGSSSGGVTNYSFRNGSYTKIGNIVHLCGYIVATEISTPLGDAIISNLPFVCKYTGNTRFWGGVVSKYTFLGGGTSIPYFVEIEDSLNFLRIKTPFATNVSATNIANNSTIAFSITYQTE